MIVQILDKLQLCSRIAVGHFERFGSIRQEMQGNLAGSIGQFRAGEEAMENPVNGCSSSQ